MSCQIEWIDLRQSTLDDDVKPENGVSIHMVVSQYDRPREARACVERETGAVWIEFRYLSSEPTRSVSLSDRILANIGKNSNRVYALRVSGPFKDAEQIKVDVDAALERLNTVVSRGKPLHSRSYSAARKALDENFSSFVPQLAIG